MLPALLQLLIRQPLVSLHQPPTESRCRQLLSVLNPGHRLSIFTNRSQAAEDAPEGFQQKSHEEEASPNTTFPQSNFPDNVNRPRMSIWHKNLKRSSFVMYLVERRRARRNLQRTSAYVRDNAVHEASILLTCKQSEGPCKKCGGTPASNCSCKECSCTGPVVPTKKCQPGWKASPTPKPCHHGCSKNSDAPLPKPCSHGGCNKNTTVPIPSVHHPMNSTWVKPTQFTNSTWAKPAPPVNGTWLQKGSVPHVAPQPSAKQETTLLSASSKTAAPISSAPTYCKSITLLLILLCLGKSLMLIIISQQAAQHPRRFQIRPRPAAQLPE